MLAAQKTRISMNTINIPQEFNFNSEEVYINKIGDIVMITPVSRLADTLERGAEILAMFAPDFMEDGRPDTIPAVRDEL